MLVPSEEEPEAQPSRPSSRPRRRWLQISLRTLLVVTALAALAALTASWYEAPFRRQREAIAAIEKAGGTYQASPAGPAWLRRLFGEDSFRNVTLVNLADCDDPAAYIEHVARLPALETLVVGGPAFTDDHLQRLRELTALTGLVLDCAEVTGDGVAALGETLPRVEIYQSQRRAIAALRSKAGDPPNGMYPDPTSHYFKVDTIPNELHPELQQLLGAEYFDEAKEVRGSGRVNDAFLAHVHKLRTLRNVFLDRTQISDAGLAHLQGLSDLKALRLYQTQVGDAGLAHLRGLSNLQLLMLDGTRITDVGLAHVKGLTNLQSLHLDSTRITDAGLEHLKGLTSLQSLHLWGTPIGDAGLSHLRGLTQLRFLQLGSTRVTDAGMVHVRNLRQLLLQRTPVGDAGLAHLQDSRQLSDLRLGVRVTDAGLRHLRHLDKLTYLDLGETQVTDAGLQPLTGLKELRNLVLPPKVSMAAIQELRRALPNCYIRQ